MFLWSLQPVTLWAECVFWLISDICLLQLQVSKTIEKFFGLFQANLATSSNSIRVSSSLIICSLSLQLLKNAQGRLLNRAANKRNRKTNKRRPSVNSKLKVFKSKGQTNRARGGKMICLFKSSKMSLLSTALSACAAVSHSFHCLALTDSRRPFKSNYSDYVRHLQLIWKRDFNWLEWRRPTVGKWSRHLPEAERSLKCVQSVRSGFQTLETVWDAIHLIQWIGLRHLISWNMQRHA